MYKIGTTLRVETIALIAIVLGLFWSIGELLEDDYVPPASYDPITQLNTAENAVKTNQTSLINNNNDNDGWLKILIRKWVH